MSTWDVPNGTFLDIQSDKMFAPSGGKRADPRPAPAIAKFKFGIINAKLKKVENA